MQVQEKILELLAVTLSTVRLCFSQESFENFHEDIKVWSIATTYPQQGLLITENKPQKQQNGAFPCCDIERVTSEIARVQKVENANLMSMQLIKRLIASDLIPTRWLFSWLFQ
jgi:hypothetical protein